MTSEDEEIYNNSHICWICKQELNMDKVRDHCHVTGKFRGAAHNKCNINLRLPKKLPIIFHNLQGYDDHLIFKELNDFNVDFNNSYFKKYVLLLVDVFEKFIFRCLKYYDLNPCHYFSTSGLSWDAMLKMTEYR